MCTAYKMLALADSSRPGSETGENERIGTNSTNATEIKMAEYASLLVVDCLFCFGHVSQTNHEEMRSIFE